MYKLAFAIASVFAMSSLAWSGERPVRMDAGISTAAENAATRQAEQSLEAELSRFEADVAQAREDAATPPVIEYRSWTRSWTPVFGNPTVDRYGGVHRRSTYH